MGKLNSQGNMRNISLIKLGADDCRDVVSLHRAAFDGTDLSHTIYISHKVEIYLRNLTIFQKLQRGHEFYGASIDGDLVGYAHMRPIDDSFHLNNIAVRPACQGHGIGKVLIDFWMRLALERRYTKLSLLVKESAEQVLSWYGKLGFEPAEKTYFYERELDLHKKVSLREIALLDWEAAEAWQHLYGFSHFRLNYQKRCWDIGRLGNVYFKVFADFPLVLESVLADLEPNRKLLVVSQRPLSGLGLSTKNVSILMKKAVQDT